MRRRMQESQVKGCGWVAVQMCSIGLEVQTVVCYKLGLHVEKCRASASNGGYAEGARLWCGLRQLVVRPQAPMTPSSRDRCSCFVCFLTFWYGADRAGSGRGKTLLGVQVLLWPCAARLSATPALCAPVVCTGCVHRLRVRLRCHTDLSHKVYTEFRACSSYSVEALPLALGRGGMRPGHVLLRLCSAGAEHSLLCHTGQVLPCLVSTGTGAASRPCMRFVTVRPEPV